MSAELFFYKDNPRSVILAYLVGERKGRGKNLEARLQSAYDGAALVMQGTRPFLVSGSLTPPGHAEVMTFTTDGANLNLYTHYVILPEDETVKYYQYPVTLTNLADSHQGSKVGEEGAGMNRTTQGNNRAH